MKTHKELSAWTKSIDLAVEIYALTRTMPKEELYVLTSQLRRAAISVPSNIAEGSARKSNAEYRHFLYIALGSLMELETQLIIANKLNYLNESTVQQLLLKHESIAKMLSGLISRQNRIIKNQ